MTPSGSDPRVFFASERTLLAWLRTGLTIMGLGFVVARFGLFLRVISNQTSAATHPIPSHPAISATMGIAFTIVGSTAILIAAVQHRRFIATLPTFDLPHTYSHTMAIRLAMVVGALGLMLSVYLLIASF